MKQTLPFQDKVLTQLAFAFKSLPNDKNLDMTKLKAFADDKL